MECIDNVWLTNQPIFTIYEAATYKLAREEWTVRQELEYQVVYSQDAINVLFYLVALGL